MSAHVFAELELCLTTKKMLALTFSGTRGASSRYRVYQFLPYFHAVGMDVRVIPRKARSDIGLERIRTVFRERADILGAARRADVVLIQKCLFPSSVLKEIGAQCKIVFDFDDAIWTSERANRSLFSNWRTKARLHETLRLADLVIAGNIHLAAYAERYSTHVKVVPTVVDLARYRAKRTSAASELIVGWIGHSANFRYLSALQGPLADLALECNFKLLVVADREFAMDGVRVENRQWSEERECDDLLDMDVGLMPLPDDQWARGKCALKAIQYMAAGIPVLASAVGANCEVVRDGIDGFLIDQLGEWKTRLMELFMSAAKRERFGAAGREQVRNKYSLDLIAGEVAASIRGLCA